MARPKFHLLQVIPEYVRCGLSGGQGPEKGKTCEYPRAFLLLPGYSLLTETEELEAFSLSWSLVS